jgi:peptidylprolyl isomerase
MTPFFHDPLYVGRPDLMKYIAAIAVSLMTQSLIAAPKVLSMGEILERAPANDWENLDPQRLLVMDLGANRTVILYLAPNAAPNTVRNIQTLAKAGYYDGLSIVRSQENYVVQWGDPEGDTPQAKSPGTIGKTLKAEFDLPLTAKLFVPLAARDAYADAVGFWDGFPAARALKAKRQWLTHCTAMLGVGRGETADSGTGQELYVVIGHAPRHLDRNVTIVGRVISGMDHLSILPRGTGALGFYEKPEQRTKIISIKRGDQMESAAQPNYQRLKTRSKTFAQLVESRKDRRDGWFLHSPKAIDVCNVPLPVRIKK